MTKPKLLPTCSVVLHVASRAWASLLCWKPPVMRGGVGSLSLSGLLLLFCLLSDGLRSSRISRVQNMEQEGR